MKKTLIERIEVGSGGAASITFSSIPQTYTDLYVVVSGRTTATEASGGSYANLKPNNTTASQSMRTLRGTGSSVSSNSETTVFFTVNPSDATSNTFANSAVYIPNYTGSQNKSMSVDGLNENNATGARQELAAALYSTSSPISSLVLTPGSGNFVQYSSASLYGVTAGNDGTTTVS